MYGLETDDKKFHVITDFIKSAKLKNHIDIKTSGQEERQFLHAIDCSKCLEILMHKYHEISRDKNLHITSFEWSKITQIAEIVCSIKNCSFSVGQDHDIQQNKRNEPDKFILNFWKPEINLENGIKLIYNQM